MCALVKRVYAFVFFIYCNYQKDLLRVFFGGVGGWLGVFFGFLGWKKPLCNAKRIFQAVGKNLLCNNFLLKGAGKQT